MGIRQEQETMSLIEKMSRVLSCILALYLMYLLFTLNKMSKQWNLRNKIKSRERLRERNCPRDGTNYIGLNGGWCLRASERKKECCKTRCEEFCRWGYAIPWPHAKADEGLAKELAELIGSGSVLDLGAGVGQYGQWFLENVPSVEWHGFDGADNVEEYTNGFVRFSDLTMYGDDLGPKRKWVISLEVGEHVPSKFEGAYIDNVCKMALNGIVLSWAIEGQGGVGHVNELDNARVVAKMKERGWLYDTITSQKLRAAADHKWFKRSIMVFIH